MLIDATIRSGDVTVDGYIAQLEQEVVTFGSQNAKQLIRSIDLMAKKISKDLDLISSEQKNEDGTEVELSGKVVDTFLKMVEKADKIVKFIELADSIYSSKENVVLIETTVETTTTTTEETIEAKPSLEIGDNPFEKIMKKVKEKKNGNKT